MAGRGSRLRPHTLTTPKPLVPVAGMPIVERLVRDISAMSDEEVKHIGFIIGDFGDEVEKDLLAIASDLGATGHIFHQEEALGTAHAILCAKELLVGKTVVAFADTLFRADFSLKTDVDGILYVKQIPNPEAFGVLKLNEEGVIVDYIEKPEVFVSDLAMIGIYYFKEAEKLRVELEYLIDNNIIKGGEYQLPDALKRLTEKGASFVPGKVSDWLDCGNKNATVDSNTHMLGFLADEVLVSSSARIVDSKIIEPCFIGDNVLIENSVVGPYVSIGDNSKVVSSIVDRTIIQKEAVVENAVITNSMIGNKATYIDSKVDLSIGDYTTIEK